MCNINNKPLVLSQHVKERYAERIKSKEDKSTIAVYVAQNEDRIYASISKMIEYSTLVYTGKSFNKDNNKIISVYLCNLWILFVDNDTNTVITLYPIDLGVGDEFNKTFVEKIKEKINDSTSAWQELKEKSAQDIAEYKDLIEINDGMIKDYRKTVKSLEEQNEDYKNLISLANSQVEAAELEVREIIAKLIGKKNF